MFICFANCRALVNRVKGDWRVKTFNIKNHERWSFLFLDIDKQFNHRWRVFPLIGGSFFLNMTINFIENYLASFTNARFWWIYQAARNFVGETFFVIFHSYICLGFLHFSILSEIGSFSVIFSALLFILYSFVSFDFL